MKPIKPKKMPKRLEVLLRTCATHPVTHDLGLPQSDVRRILSALEYERQRADALKSFARDGLKAFHGSACLMGVGAYPENPAECADPKCREWAETINKESK